MWACRGCDEHRIIEKLYNVAHELCFGETNDDIEGWRFLLFCPPDVP